MGCGWVDVLDGRGVGSVWDVADLSVCAFTRSKSWEVVMVLDYVGGKYFLSIFNSSEAFRMDSCTVHDFSVNFAALYTPSW